MVCIAAFIILAIIGIFVAIVSIFKPKVGKSYLKMFKKAWGCLWKKVRLQKCETGFKDDVKNTLLSRVIVKHPKWVKPLSAIIEILSVVIVAVAVWALLTAIKSLLALWALGSCNVTKPSACSLGAEVCSIDEEEPKNIFEATGRWFTEWGEIFEAIPDKFREYKAEDYDFAYVSTGNNEGSDKAIAVDIFDPGCTVCLRSYLNQKNSGFFEEYDVRLVPFAIQDANNSFKFKNSEITVRWMFAAEDFRKGLALEILDHVFTGKNSEGVSYQIMFNEYYTQDEAVSRIQSWLKQAGVSKDDVKKIAAKVDSAENTERMSRNRNIIENELRVKGIPTMIYRGAKHTGLYQKES